MPPTETGSSKGVLEPARLGAVMEIRRSKGTEGMEGMVAVVVVVSPAHLRSPPFSPLLGCVFGSATRYEVRTTEHSLQILRQ